MTIYYITEGLEYEGYSIVFMHTSYDVALSKFQELKKNVSADYIAFCAWDVEKQQESEIDLVHRKKRIRKRHK